jgi:YHS domain-containing protein
MKELLLIGLIAATAVFADDPKKTTDKPAQAQKQAKEETTPQTDLVCGMTVDPKTAEGKYVYKGKTYYFCSKDDQQEFAKAPEKYVKK